MPGITEERVREVLNHSTLIGTGEWADHTAVANEDAEEGAEFLPYYKLALGLEIQAVGILEGLLSKKGMLSGKEQSLLNDARGLVRLAQRAIGIGPDTTPERAAKVDKFLDENWC